jgi:hypothetical protein
MDRWLVSTPQLASLIFCRPGKETCVSLSPLVTLPHLVHLDMKYIRRAGIVSVLQMLPTPSRSLIHIFMIMNTAVWQAQPSRSVY